MGNNNLTIKPVERLKITQLYISKHQNEPLPNKPYRGGTLQHKVCLDFKGGGCVPLQTRYPYGKGNENGILRRPHIHWADIS